MWQDLMRGLNSYLVKRSSTLLCVAWAIAFALVASGLATIITAQVGE
jgi:hypothetical protein